MLASIETIRAIERRCRSQEPLSAEQSRWLGEALSAFLEHKTPSIDSALGLANPRGGVPWWLEEAIRKRNAALCDLARNWFADLSASAQAEQIWKLATRYAASAWRFDQDLEAMPAHYSGTPKHHLWAAFSSGAAMPLGKRQLRSVLAGAT
ncbi:MAG: hypothetical protein R3285_06585 [Kiloniellales bacterium]|nr:hypothetical protein [Kiloniellales bacterium]